MQCFLGSLIFLTMLTPGIIIPQAAWTRREGAQENKTFAATRASFILLMGRQRDGENYDHTQRVLAIVLVYHERNINNDKYKHFNKRLWYPQNYPQTKPYKSKLTVYHRCWAQQGKIIVHLLPKDMVRSLIKLLTVPSWTRRLTTTCCLWAIATKIGRDCWHMFRR